MFCIFKKSNFKQKIYRTSTVRPGLTEEEERGKRKRKTKGKRKTKKRKTKNKHKNYLAGVPAVRQPRALRTNSALFSTHYHRRDLFLAPFPAWGGSIFFKLQAEAWQPPHYDFRGGANVDPQFGSGSRPQRPLLSLWPNHDKFNQH